MSEVITLRGGHQTSDPRLDRIPQWDERNQQFMSTRRLTALPPIEREWPVSKWLNQGQEGACVGFGWSHEALATPFPIDWVEESDAFSVYEAARFIDEWEGEDYEGTSVLAGAKVMQERGFIAGYLWTYTVPELVLAVGYDGPAVIGVDWHYDMMNTDRNGFIHASGGVAGGHCTCVKGVHPDEEYFTIHNSWGKDWGRDGEAKISFSDMALLLSNYGEACIPVGRKWAKSPRERAHDLM